MADREDVTRLPPRVCPRERPTRLPTEAEKDAVRQELHEWIFWNRIRTTVEARMLLDELDDDGGLK